MFFTESESDSESGLEQKMNQAKEGLNSDDKNQRIEALKQVTDVIMVSFLMQKYFLNYLTIS